MVALFLPTLSRLAAHLPGAARGTFIKRGPCIRHDDETASRLAPKRVYDRFDFGVVVNGGRVRRHLERSGGPSNEGRLFDATKGAVSGLNIIPTRLTPGAISVSNSTHLPPNDASEVMNPARFPPGRGRLAVASGDNGRLDPTFRAHFSPNETIGRP
jgi:hypothetical protein